MKPKAKPKKEKVEVQYVKDPRRVNIPTSDSITKLARRNIGSPQKFKTMRDYTYALRDERKRLANRYNNKELLQELVQKLDESTVTLGRTVTYRPEFSKVARIVCSLYGSTPVELAKFFRVDTGAISSWMAEYPEFYAAVTDRSTEMNMQIMGRLARRALGFYADTEKVFYDVKRGDVVKVPTKEYHPPSESAIMFWLKNRMPEHWKDTKEVSTEENKRITLEIYKNFDSMTTEQASDAYQELLKIEGGASQKGTKTGPITDVPIIERDPSV